jgi:hypothetical protein
MTRAALLSLLCLLTLVPSAGAEIRVVDAATGVARTIVHDEGRLGRWSDDNAAVLVHRGRRVLRVGASNGSVTRLAQLRRAHDLGPGGRSVVVTGGGSSQRPTRVQLRGPDGQTVGVDTFQSTRNVDVAWSRDGSRALVSVSPYLGVYDTATGRPVLRGRLDDLDVGEQPFAPDGSAVLVASGSALVRIDLASGAGEVVLRSESQYDPPAAVWSATGRIAVSTSDWARVLDSPPLELPPALHEQGSPSWDPEGTTLAYLFESDTAACGPSPVGLGTVIPGQAPRILIAPSYQELWGLAWSPDGRSLAVELGKPLKATHHWPKHVDRDYAMGRRGNTAMRRVVLQATRALRHGAGRDEALTGASNGMRRVLKHFHVYDTMIVESVAVALDGWLRAAGYPVIDALDELDC